MKCDHIRTRMQGDTPFFPNMLNNSKVEVWITEERDKTIEGLQADYKEACDRLQTANLIKDEQLAATRHQKRKRCLDKAELCESRALFYGNLIPKVLNKDIADASRQKVFRRLKYHKKWHMRWLELAEKFKEAK